MQMQMFVVVAITMLVCHAMSAVHRLAGHGATSNPCMLLQGDPMLLMPM
jgi:hypothetical protein